MFLKGQEPVVVVRPREGEIHPDEVRGWELLIDGELCPGRFLSKRAAEIYAQHVLYGD